MKKLLLLIILSMFITSCDIMVEQSTETITNTPPDVTDEPTVDPITPTKKPTPEPSTPEPVTEEPTNTPTVEPTSSDTETTIQAMIIIGNEFGNTYFDMKTELVAQGFSVVTVGVGGEDLFSSCPNHPNRQVIPDMNIKDITSENISDFSLVFIPAGKHHRTIPYSKDVQRVLNISKENSIYISSVCAGNIVLASVDGLIDGYEIATSSVTKDYISKAGGISKYKSVVVDDYFVTGDKGGGKSGGGHTSAPIKEMAETLKSLINGK